MGYFSWPTAALCPYPKYHMFFVCYLTSALPGTALLMSSGPVQGGAYGWFTLVGLWHQVMHQQFSFNAVSRFLACTNLSETDVHIQLLEEKKAVLLSKPADSIHELYYCKH